MKRRSVKKSLAAAAVTGCLIASAACSSGSSSDSASSGAAKLDPAKLGPAQIIGQGPNGEKASSLADIQLSAADAAKVRAGKFKVGLVMHTLNLDWSKLQIAGIKETFKKYGVTVMGTTDSDYKVDKQVADIENTIQRKPDGIISIPVDNTATAPAFKKVGQAGIKLVFMDNVPRDLKYPGDYQSMISADSQGNGQVAAEVLANRIPKGGTVGVIDFGIDFFVTNQRTKGVRDWLKANRPDIKIKTASFTDPAKAGQTAGDFLTANPDVKGLFAVWDAPALDTLSAMRAQSVDIPVTTIDLGLEAAIEIAKGGPLIGLGAQRPYDQGVAEATAMMKTLIKEDPPAWIGVKALPVIESNVLEGYKTVWHTDPPKDLANACKASGSSCG